MELKETKIIKTDHEVFCVALSPNKKWLADGTTFDKDIEIWDTNDWTLKHTLEGTSTIVDISFSKDGKWLASGSIDKTIKIWDTNDWTLKHTLEGHTNPVLIVVFSKDGKWLASASKDKTIKI